MKKTMALVMAACMAGATLVGCGSSPSSAAPAGDSSTSTAASSSDKAGHDGPDLVDRRQRDQGHARLD